MDNIRQAFASYFDTPGVELPEPIPARGAIEHGGWTVSYVLAGKPEPHLDVFA